LTQEEAQEKYIALVEEFKPKYHYDPDMEPTPLASRSVPVPKK
jgi:hypothetical protein